MSWNLTDDEATFLSAAGAFLRADPVADTVALSVLGGGAAGTVFGWWPGPTGADATFLLSDGYPLLLSAMPERRAELLGETLTRRTLPGVNGEPAAARAFAGVWERRTGSVA